jgi:hypothetical protein
LDIRSEKEISVYCPKCHSKDVAYKYFYSSIYGALPSNNKDFCKSCGFTSESFYHLNLQALRDEKINIILNNKDGI